MSRHRYVKNLNIADELEDDALSDGGEEEMTAEEQLQMNDALEQVREVIGEEDISGLPDSEVKDTIWYYHFDVQESIDWCLQEQQKRQAAKERQGSPPVQYTHYEPSERPRIPLIHLAQQQQRQWEEQNVIEAEFGDEGELEGVEGTAEAYPPRRSLTPITERTELSSLWRYRSPTEATSTSYGNIISSGQFEPPPDSPLDPNTIPLSPSESALHRLSIYEPAPTRTSSASRSSITSSPRPPSEPVPPIDTIPDIPDSPSRSTLPAAQKSLSSRPTQQKAAKQSKLAQLASSRASSRTKSSASLGTERSGSESNNTYPALRPAEQSIRPLSSVVPHSIVPSSTSLHVDKAIQIAMDMEALDRADETETESPKTNKPLPKAPSARSKLSEKARSSGSNAKSVTTSRPAAPTPSKASQMPLTDSPVSPRPLSKLALLAQQKTGTSDVKKVLGAPVTRPPPDYLPEEHTEYLVPVANGPTATTAITTSYQTLYSLTDPLRHSANDSLRVVPLPTVNYSSTTTQAPTKPSKLAMKIRKAHEKHAPPTVEEIPSRYEVPSMFLPHATRSASPSAFASILVDNNHLNHEGAEEKKKKDKGKEKARTTTTTASSSSFSTLSSTSKSKSTSTSTSISTSTSTTSTSTAKHHRSIRRKDRTIPDMVSPSAFTFDIPSPDDIVLNARRGTTLERKATASSRS
ncbi:hypothetical protein PM082_005159 [Marasmius tenuissimus]|nr:hypothetical protein PM082_005159 [Marasmius tenuissimus]